MIKNIKALSLAETTEYISKDKESSTDLKRFIKKFKKLKLNEAKKLREKIQKLDLMKINEGHLVKIIDFMPENAEELNKIFTDVALHEDETNKILETVKEFK